MQDTVSPISFVKYREHNYTELSRLVVRGVFVWECVRVWGMRFDDGITFLVSQIILLTKHISISTFANTKKR